ncbi:MAG TPA: TetR/AcrR family transcriptional regulator [Pyrinomonadaceae bacterium]|jgi:AcrR family transcriptional regulator|nr:TetR/AcrR family transcriptional regulator [Pyrinomonadaceae bacterium]
MMKAQKKAAPNNERLAEIYRTAAQIILRKGYDATSVNDIANALGMTKAGLYHYINGKKELLFDIMNFGLDELDEEVVTPACAIADTGAKLRYIIESHARLVTRGQGAITILVDEITALTPAQNRKITRRKREYFDSLRNVLNQLKKEGRLQDVNTTAATFSLLGMIHWLSRWFRQEGALTEEQVAEDIVKIALKGLLRPESRAARRGLRVVKD